MSPRKADEELLLRLAEREGDSPSATPDPPGDGA